MRAWCQPWQAASRLFEEAQAGVWQALQSRRSWRTAQALGVTVMLCLLLHGNALLDSSTGL